MAKAKTIQGDIVSSWDRDGVRYLAVRVSEDNGSGTEYNAGLALTALDGLSDGDQQRALIDAVARVFQEQRGVLLQVAGHDPAP